MKQAESNSPARHRQEGYPEGIDEPFARTTLKLSRVPLLDRIREEIMAIVLGVAAVGLAAGVTIGAAEGGEGKRKPVPGPSAATPAVVPGGIPALVVGEAAGERGMGEKGGTSGDVVGCEHFAFLRPSLAGSLGGPALEAVKSWDGEMGGTFAPDGTYYQTDVNNCTLFRVRDGQARILAGDRTRGWRDGPADQAQFDLGVGSYSDADVHCDAAGNVFVSEAQAGRLRKIERRQDGTWWVSTVAGGGTREPRKGQPIPAREMKAGCAARFALAPDGTAYFATWGGLFQVTDGQGILLAGSEELKKALGEKTPLADWHTGGSHLTPDGMFYWMPGGGPNILRFDTKTAKAERFAGAGRTVAGLDGPTLLESGFHTVLAVFNPDASVIYTCGGDESVPRRICDGRVMTLHRDGTFRPYVKGPSDERWSNMAAAQCLDSEGRLYLCTGDYGWGGWIVRMTFAGGGRASVPSVSASSKRLSKEHPTLAPPAEPGDGQKAISPQSVAPQCLRDGRRLQRQPAVVRGKTVYLVAWCDGTLQAERPTADIYCARIDADTGKSLDPAGIRVCAATDLQERPAVAHDGKNFLVVWQDFRNGKDYDIFAARVDEQGKVLDPDGFPVVQRPNNQARPAVAFGGGNFLLAWMDARQYPVYGLYAARVSPDGKVLDSEGRALDVEDPAKIAKAAPPAKSWLGDRKYWWQSLSSRFQPSMASDGIRCLVTYNRDMHSNKTVGQALLADPSNGSIVGKPVQLPGEPRDRIAACAVPGGWAVAFDHWIGGWGYAARMASVRLDDASKPREEIVDSPEGRRAQPPPLQAPRLDLQKALAGGGGDYQQGKGHFCFWQTAIAANSQQTVVVMDYGWRTKQKPNELNYAIVASRVADGRFLDDPPLVVASGNTAAERCVRHPDLAAGPAGEFLLIHENDAGVDQLTLEARILRFR
jgi:hypothetical protein